MFEGKVRTALRVLNESGSTVGTPLSLSAPLSDSDPSLGTVHEAILLKYPEPTTASPDYCLLTNIPPHDHDPHFVEFDIIDGVHIRRALMWMDGGAGPYGLDVSGLEKNMLVFC